MGTSTLKKESKWGELSECPNFPGAVFQTEHGRMTNLRRQRSEFREATEDVVWREERKRIATQRKGQESVWGSLEFWINNNKLWKHRMRIWDPKNITTIGKLQGNSHRVGRHWSSNLLEGRDLLEYSGHSVETQKGNILVAQLNINLKNLKKQTNLESTKLIYKSLNVCQNKI